MRAGAGGNLKFKMIRDFLRSPGTCLAHALLIGVRKKDVGEAELFLGDEWQRKWRITTMQPKPVLSAPLRTSDHTALAMPGQ